VEDARRRRHSVDRGPRGADRVHVSRARLRCAWAAPPLEMGRKEEERESGRGKARRRWTRNSWDAAPGPGEIPHECTRGRGNRILQHQFQQLLELLQ
jgi:hypothetical protein